MLRQDDEHAYGRPPDYAHGRSEPGDRDILNSVSETLNIDNVRELNGQVDLDQEEPKDVARGFLQEQGLI